MRKFILNPIPVDQAQSISVELNATLDNLKPYSAPSTAEEKEGVHTMARGREGIVRLVSRVALQHSDSLSRIDVPEELIGLLNLSGDLQSIRQASLELEQMSKDLLFANGAEIMILFQRYKSSLQATRGSDASLNEAMKEVDEWYKRYGHEEKDGETAGETTGTPEA